MNKIFKAFSIGMTVLAALGEAMEEGSDEGTDISQREFVRIAIRSGLAAVKAFGKEITNTDEDITAIIEEELEMLKLAGQSG